MQEMIENMQSLIDGMTGMIRAARDKEAIDKVAARGMIARARKQMGHLKKAWKAQEKAEKFVIVVGDPLNGLNIGGDSNGLPFMDANTANELATDRFKDETWWVMQVWPVASEKQG